MLIKIFKIFNENGEIQLQNKMINSLTNKKLYINNNKNYLYEIFFFEIINVSNNICQTISTCEILLNIIQMNNFISNEKINEINILLDIIIVNMPFNEFIFLLIKIKDDKYLNDIKNNFVNIKIIMNKIFLNLNALLKKYQNNNEIELIKNKLEEIFNKYTDINKYNEIINLEKLFLDENKFLIFLFELLSILLQLNNNYLLTNRNIYYFEKIISFLKDIKIKDKRMDLGFFKTFFFELYDANKYINKSIIKDPSIQRLKYIENEMQLNDFIPKKMDNYLYTYFNDLINFILELDSNEDIMKEILLYFEKLCNLYSISINTENKKYNYIICNLTHIFKSKQINNKIFKYLKLIYTKFSLDKINLSQYLNIKPIITFPFHGFKNPEYFSIIKKILYDWDNFNNYYLFLNEIINIISKENEKINNVKNINIIELNKNFYYNSIELLKIFFSSIKYNTNLLNDNNFFELFIKYFEFLKRNKMLVSKYLINSNLNDNNNLFCKTILEICSQIIILSLIKRNKEEQIFKIYLNGDNCKSLLNILDSLNKNLSYNKKDIIYSKYINDNFNKYLKNNGNKEEENSIFIILINKLFEYKIQSKYKSDNQNKYNDKIINQYLQYILEELYNFCDYSGNWKKIGKDKLLEEEIKLIKGFKENKNYEEIIQAILDFKLKNEGNKIIKADNEEKIKEKIKAEDKKIDIDNKDNILENENNKFLDECPFKKGCLLLKNEKNENNNNNILNDNKNINDGEESGNFMDFDIPNSILCLKRDLLLKQCSIYFDDIYFNDKNFIKLKQFFKIKVENKSTKIHVELEKKLKYPTKIKNFSNSDYAYPNIFYSPNTLFYNNDTFIISHPYFPKESIKKQSFPLLLSHYFLDNIFDEKEFFNEECEVLLKGKIICGNIHLKDKIILFINNNQIKEEYGQKIKYLFSSIKEDVKNMNKIIIIKYKDIKEIIVRRYLYDFRAIEIFLKNGKSYFFNLYTKENILQIFDIIEKNIKNKNNLYNFEIIKDPKIYFNQQKYRKKWEKDEISTYQYLLYINKFSSRSFNEVNQYPIFPWIFLDSSNSVNLPKLRDLTYPISIRNKDDIEDSHLFFRASYDENPKYPTHFRLHYSTYGYLLNYLVRASPYTEEQIYFQGNQFDNPNRQIQYIEEIVNILSESHDNRELIPEYFTTIEFFLNVNYNYFGNRTGNNETINDICCQKCFNSLSQYIYYNHLMLNKRENISDINNINLVLKLNSWIDLIFGVSQWDEKPNEKNLNLFGKYCYKQNINFDKILEKYKTKTYDEKTIIKKIVNKKSRIINFGQCPEVLFNKKIPDEEVYLHESTIQSPEKDDLDINDSISYSMINLENKEVVTFWISENNNYIYFLISNKDNSQSILIYEIHAQKQKEPNFKINLNEIILFKPKGKVKSVKFKKDISKLTSKDVIKDIQNTNMKRNSFIEANDKERTISESMVYQSNMNKNKTSIKAIERKITYDTNIINEKEKEVEKSKTVKKQKQVQEEVKEQYYYKISPKYILFDICLDNILYIFVGRNMDNSIKIYEQILKNNDKSELKYNIFTDSFVSCLYKKDKNSFFSGHKNGKLYEWKIIYPDSLNKKSKSKKNNNMSSINTIELERDIMAHKESMICSINYIKKHNIIITTSMDGNLCIRKYIDFELLSLFPKQKENSIITKVIYTEYDLLYLLISKKDSLYNSKIKIYTLNGLLIESSKMNNFIDIEPLKNGKIICNNLYSRKLNIFGFNENMGDIEEEDILKNLGDNDIRKAKIINFIYEQKNNIFYLLLDNGKVYKMCNDEFKSLSKGAHKLKNYEITNIIKKDSNKNINRINTKEINNNKDLRKSSDKKNNEKKIIKNN